MKWQDLLKRRPEKEATIESGKQPRVVVEQPEAPEFGRKGFLAGENGKPVEQPVEVEMKDQVMGRFGA